MSIERSISPTLSNLIAEANYTIESVKEKILVAYNYAINTDGYTPLEAAKVLREKLAFSRSYIREVLPNTAKDQSKTKLTIQQDRDDEPPAAHHGLNTSNQIPDEKLEDIPEEQERTLPTAYEIHEAESEEIPNEEKEINEGEILPNEIPPNIILQLQERETLQQRVKELLARNEELENKLQDKSFDVIQNTKDTIKHGTYDLEIKDRIIPLKWNYSLTTERIVIEIDVNRAKRMGI